MILYFLLRVLNFAFYIYGFNTLETYFSMCCAIRNLFNLYFSQVDNQLSQHNLLYSLFSLFFKPTVGLLYLLNHVSKGFKGKVKPSIWSVIPISSSTPWCLSRYLLYWFSVHFIYFFYFQKLQPYRKCAEE